MMELDHPVSQLYSRARLAVASMLEDVCAGRCLHVQPWYPLLDAISAVLRHQASAMFLLIRSREEDSRTVMHSVSVCVLMMVLAQRLGHSAERVREAGLAGILHDAGRSLMQIDSHNRTGELSPEEIDLGKVLPRIGHDLLQRAGCTSTIALDACLHRHERVDGAGFPDGLGGTEITVQAKMLAICDVYDEMTSEPLDEDGLEPAQAIVRMAALTRQGQFCPKVFLAFVECIGIYPVGSLVRLKSGRIGLVTRQSDNVPYSPHVRVFYSTGAGEPISVETVDLSRPDCGDDIVARESNREWRFGALGQLLVCGATGAHTIGRRSAAARHGVKTAPP